MRINKVEHHSVDWHYTYELDADKLQEIYPDLTVEEITLLELELSTGTKDIEDVIFDAWNHSVDLDWDLEYEDVWTDRKGSYEITYSVVEEE